MQYPAKRELSGGFCKPPAGLRCSLLLLSEIEKPKERMKIPYAILRFAKRKAGGVTASYAHNERKKAAYKSNPDIDMERSKDNYHLVRPAQTYRKEITRLITSAGCKTRSNSTVMVETLITASPEFMNSLSPPEQREYFARACEFMADKIEKENIISAVVHMDEKSPHMHLSFCPITKDRKLSAKALLGNQAQLSKWQTQFHEWMSARYPVLERGISSMETKRKHIPVWLFKAAEWLDKQYTEVVTALDGINPINAKRKRDSAMRVLEKWLPEAVKFTAQLKQVDSYIKTLEQAEKETKERIRQVENKGKEQVRSVQDTMQKAIDGKDERLAEKDEEILTAKREAYAAAEKLRHQANQINLIVGKLPFEMRTRFYQEQEKVAANAAKSKTRRR